MTVQQLIPLILLAVAPIVSGADLTPLLCKKGTLLFSDDFDAAAIKPEWVPLHGTQWSVSAGTLKGVPSSKEYQASRKKHSGGTPSSRLKVPVKDVILQFDFKLADSLDGVHFGFNDGSVKTGTGHVCRVTVHTKHGMSLIKDKSSKVDGDQDEVLATSPFKVVRDKWYTIMLELRGDELVAQLSDGPTLVGRHKRVDIKKDQINLPTRGGGTIYYDNVRVWSGTANPKWPAIRKELAGSQ